MTSASESAPIEKTARRLAISALSGFAMALALGLGRLTRPEVIIGWVDVFGDWDPSLLIFFIPAGGAYHIAVRIARKREARGLVDLSLCMPSRKRVDANLLIGSGIFGIGWAVAGACPGPALTSLGAGAPWTVAFVLSMVVGLKVDRSLFSKLTKRHQQTEQTDRVLFEPTD